MIYKFNITAFDGEGGGNAGAAAVSGGNSQVAAEIGAQSFGSTTQTDAASINQGETFDDYVKAHKEDADKWFQDKFNRRHKDYNKLKERVTASDKVMDMLATKFGIDDRKDIAAITEALERDDYLYAERAEENGRTIEEQRQWDELDRENRMFREQQKLQQQQEDMQRQVSEWEQQTNNLKQVFPTFDLENELSTNEAFKQLLLQGMSVSSAFYAVHGEEIASGAMEYTANAVRQATAQDIATRGTRPRENSLSGQSAAKVVGKDFSHMSLKELREYGAQHAIR